MAKKPGWDRKAEAQWREVSKGPAAADLKSLILDVKGALAEKQKANQKTSKKAAKLQLTAKKEASKKAAQRDAIIAAAMEAVASDPVAEADRVKAITQQSEVAEQIEAYAFAVTQAFTTLSMANPGTVARLKDMRDKAESAINSANDLVDAATLKDELDAQEPYIKAIAMAADSNDRLAKSKESFFKRATAMFRRDNSAPLVEEAEAKPNRLKTGADAARRMLGSGVAGTKNFFSKDAYGKGRAIGGLLRSGVELSKSSGPVVVKTLKSIAAGTVATGKAVKDATTSTFKWLGKRMSSMVSTLGRFLRAPFGGGAGDTLSSLFGFAALAATIIKPMIDGIDAELTRRYGDKYIQDFIGSIWSKSWSYLVNQIKRFLGIDDESTAKRQEAEAKRQAANRSAADTAQKKTVDQYKTENGYKPLTQNDPNALAAKLAYYKKARPGAGKTASKTNIQNYLDDEATSIPAPLAAELQKEGFRVPPALIVGSKSAPPSPVSSGSEVNSVRKIDLGITSSPVTVGSSSPVNAPMESSAPVTAQPPAAAPSSGGGPVKSAGEQHSALSALGARQIPTYASSDSLQVFNLGVC